MADVTGTPSHIPNEGDVVAGKYRVETPLGEGGMSVVLSAIHEGLRQRVAMKVLHPQHAASPELRERFFREARALAALHSEHVARVFDVGVLPSGAAFLVLEYLEGVDLHQLVQRDGPIPYQRAVSYAVEACEGLQEAHGLGILHRDLKPSNLFLAAHPSGAAVIKLLDFGLAKLTEEGITGLTGAEAVMGSPSYMAPEQIKGLLNADVRSDVWSMAVTLYELVSGGLPFEASNATKVAAEVLTAPPISLSSRVRHLPHGLERVIMSCLVKDPTRRTSSAAQLLEQLRPFMSHESDPALFVTAAVSSKPPLVAEQTMRMVEGRSRDVLKKEASEPTYGGLLPLVPPSDPGAPPEPRVSLPGERPDEPTLVKVPTSSSPEAAPAPTITASAPARSIEPESAIDLDAPEAPPPSMIDTDVRRPRHTFALVFGFAFALGAVIGLTIYFARGRAGTASTALGSGRSAPTTEIDNRSPAPQPNDSSATPTTSASTAPSSPRPTSSAPSPE